MAIPTVKSSERNPNGKENKSQQINPQIEKICNSMCGVFNFLKPSLPRLQVCMRSSWQDQSSTWKTISSKNEKQLFVGSLIIITKT